jgi:5-(carboxyamino)imidazole ribonucleotide synthase
MNFPSDTIIGILGGGQLGKMLIESSRPWNIRNIVLENDANCPAAAVAEKIIIGSLQDQSKINELAENCDVLTWEIEHVNVDALIELEKKGKKIIPSPKILQVIQDKGLQKEFYRNNNLNTANYFICNTPLELDENIKLIEGDKIVIKTRKGGYDGKGVSIVHKSDVSTGNYIFNEPVVLEEFIPEVIECSVIVTRNEGGEIALFPSIEMYFHPVTNLVEFLFSPGRFSNNLVEKCNKLAIAAVEKLNGVGIFAVELFILKNGNVLINEIAPRPHNSGHHSIEGCYTSQFEQLNRILLGLPLGNAGLIKPCAMVNLVGPDRLNGKYKLTYAADLLSMEGVYIHLYGKKEIRPGRKMGHITILAETMDELFVKSEKVKKLAIFESLN